MRPKEGVNAFVRCKTKNSALTYRENGKSHDTNFHHTEPTKGGDCCQWDSRVRWAPSIDQEQQTQQQQQTITVNKPSSSRKGNETPTLYVGDTLRISKKSSESRPSSALGENRFQSAREMKTEVGCGHQRTESTPPATDTSDPRRFVGIDALDDDVCLNGAHLAWHVEPGR